MRLAELIVRVPPPAAAARLLARNAPFLAYVALAVLLGAWIVDDAGISYAYAHNLARGHGLVAQPGLPPVEGYSNFLWVLLLAPFHLLRLFHPVVVPKLVAAALVLLTFLVVRRSLRGATGSEAPGWLVTAALAISPPIVVWTMSGLENALTLFLAAAFAVQLADRGARWELKAGGLAALLAMTHPELILLGGTGLIVCLGEGRGGRRSLLLYLAALAVPLAAFLALRLALFGLPLPHTYYAKRMDASALERLTALLADPRGLWDRTLALARGLGGPLGAALLLLALAGAALLALRRRMSRAVFVWALLASNAVAAYLWLDDDWMGEHRFATVPILATLVSAALVGDLLLRAWGARRAVAAAVGLAALALLLADGVPRVVRFAANPPTPYADVSRRTAAQFDAYARVLARPRASLLVADVGATLYESRLRVYDLAGLCEPEVVRTLKGNTPVWRIGHVDFYDWVFDRIKPTFISTEKFWTHVTAFERDPRFRRDYLAIDAFPDDYVRRVYGVQLHSGDFVRRDALRAAGDVERLRQAHRPAPRPDALVHRLADAWAAPRGVDAARVEALAAWVEQNDPHRAAWLLARTLGAAGSRPEDLVTTARALDAAGRPHDARAWWRRAAEVQGAAAGDFALQALDRLGDGRPTSSGGDALDPELTAGLRLLYQERRPAPALALFDQVLLANPAHYGARFQRARALTLLGRHEAARAAWTAVLHLSTRLADQPTMAAARAALAGAGPASAPAAP